MSFEVQIKRTLWVAKCRGCGEQKEQTEYKVREWYCDKCSEWVPYVEQSYVGPEIKENI